MKRITKLTLLCSLFAVLLSIAPVKAMDTDDEEEVTTEEITDEEQMPE